MVTSIGFVALLVASYMMLNFVGSQGRALDQLIAMEDQAEQLRRRCAYDARLQERNVRQRNQLLVKIARRRKALASERNLSSHEKDFRV